MSSFSIFHNSAIFSESTSSTTIPLSKILNPMPACPLSQILNSAYKDPPTGNSTYELKPNKKKPGPQPKSIANQAAAMQQKGVKKGYSLNKPRHRQVTYFREKKIEVLAFFEWFQVFIPATNESMESIRASTQRSINIFWNI